MTAPAGRTRLLAVLVALSVLSVAGCAGLDQSPTTDAAGERVTVTRVVDGDTLRVAYPDGTTDTVRLLGVDTPEVRGSNTPAEFGLPDTPDTQACLREWGERASDFAAERVGDREVTLVFDPATDRRDDFGRLLAYVRVDNGTLNRALLAEGYARVYETEFAELDAYRAAAEAARDAGRGVWTCGETSSETIALTVHADAAGNDAENLNGEYVRFRNPGTEPLDVSGWAVTDEAGHSYRFPDGTTIAPGGTLTLYTGSGQDGEGVRYWGSSTPVWNNAGDTVVVSDAEGAVVVRRTY